MGWTGIHTAKGTKVEDIFKSQFDYTNETGSSYTKVLSCKANLTEAYLAIEFKAVDKEPIVYGMVCLIRKSKDYCNFIYKAMGENVLPYYFNAPKSILDLLSPTTSDNALRWRECCLNNISKNEQRKSLVFGDNIKFDKPISFGIYGKCSTFKVDDIKKGHFFSNKLGIMIKLTKSYINNNAWNKI